jgi:hypothetical protein
VLTLTGATLTCESTTRYWKGSHLKRRLALLAAAITLGATVVAVSGAGAGTITDAVASNTVDGIFSACEPDNAWSGWHSFDPSAHGETGAVRVTAVTVSFEGYAMLRLYDDPSSIFPGSVSGLVLLWAGQIHNGDLPSNPFTTVAVNATVPVGHHVVVEVGTSLGSYLGLGLSNAGDNNSSYITGCSGRWPAPFFQWVGGFPWTITTAPADSTPPVITVPSYVDVPATSSAGTTVDFPVTATDDVDGPLTYGFGPGHFVCHPDPGSTFAIGDALVNCLAVDSSSNIGTVSFVVHVQGADEQLTHLMATVDSYTLGKLGSSLHDKLVSVQKFRAAGKTSQVCESLASFLSQVQGQTSKGLTSTQARDLAASAQRIGEIVGC